MAHVKSNTGEHVIWGSFETNPYHGTLYLSQPFRVRGVSENEHVRMVQTYWSQRG